MEEIIKNSTKKLFDANLVIELIKKNAPNFANKYDLSDLKATPIKKYIGKEFYQIVVRYDSISLFDKPIFCTAHSKENRENAQEALEYIHKQGFKQKNAFLAKPLFFDNESRAFFYQGMDGKNLLYYIKKANFDLTEYLEQTAGLIAQLHEIKTDGSKNFNPQNSRIKTVVPGPEQFLLKIEKKFPKYLNKIETEFNKLVSLEEDNLKKIGQLQLIHGDFHPENIIINEKKAQFSIIDFTDICLADWTRDIGSFLQQLRFMSSGKRSSEEIKKNQEIFLNAYLEKRSITKNSEIENRINLYKSWAALRSAIYFLIKGKPEPSNAEIVLNEINT